MSRKHSEESSLELLLDTMCNTFGGVMFIAILLSVMVSIRGQVKNNPVPDSSEKIVQVKQQVVKLQEELADMMETTAKQAESLKNMESDPRMKLIREIAMMEQMHKEKELRKKLAEQKVNLNRSTLKNLEIQTLKVVEKEEDTARILKKQQTRMKEKETRLKELISKIGTLSLRNMYFMTRVEMEKIPYFLLINNGSVWPVGPEINGTFYKPNDAVSFQVQSQRYVCSPVESKGITIFSGSGLSQRFQELLKTLPADRVPEFVISKGDAVEFDRLREILKKQNFFHGFRIQTSDQDHFEYQFVNQAGGSYAY